MISDEVWVRLDPRTGMVRRFAYGRWVLAAIAVLVAGVTWMSGAIVPRLSHDASGGSGSTSQDGAGRRHVEVLIGLEVVNEGWLPTTVTAVGVRSAGLTLRSVTLDGSGAFPRSIPPRTRMTLTLVLDVTDCRAALSEDVPLVVETEQWWGRTTAEPLAEEPWHALSVESVCRLNAS
ncbi:hypothetical protein ACIHFD_64220 [Nonomuraea sp. NPDC051941]|uniref:hypothetical protein n=1 Tax=Nonomuraea sp. NPDC051941 TaxID=3364373 RepID=UPI0037CBD11A